MVARDEALARIRAAVDARQEGADIFIFARTDARQADSLQVPAFLQCCATVPSAKTLCFDGNVDSMCVNKNILLLLGRGTSKQRKAEME